MGAFSGARERHKQAAKSQSFRKNEFQESRFAEINLKKLAPMGKDRAKARKYRFLLCVPPVAGRFPEIPLTFSRSRIELLRSPEIPKPTDPKKLAKMEFVQENEWVLNNISYLEEEDEDKPQLLDAFMEHAEACGLLEEGSGFKHPNKAVQEAVSGLLPWTEYMVPALAQATRKELSRRTSGDREYITYTLIPHKDPDLSTWTPVVLVIENDNVLNAFFDLGESFCEDHDRKVPWGRKSPAIMTITKGQKYEVAFGKYKGDVDLELYKELKEHVPDMMARMEGMQKTDEEMVESLTQSWFWPHILRKYPDMGVLFEGDDDDAEEWDEDDEDGEDEEEDDEDDE